MCVVLCHIVGDYTNAAPGCDAVRGVISGSRAQQQQQQQLCGTSSDAPGSWYAA
jgi:hypothetical protein